jgi:probable rRNA maturation factor
VLEVEIVGELPAALDQAAVERLATEAAATADIHDGHLAIEFTDPASIAALNEAHRNKRGPTDVLSFPIDGSDLSPAGPRELGDVVICPEHTADLREALIHGVLHLVGMDHETDDGEMLAVQATLLDATR